MDFKTMKYAANKFEAAGAVYGNNFTATGESTVHESPNGISRYVHSLLDPELVVSNYPSANPEPCFLKQLSAILNFPVKKGGVTVWLVYNPMNRNYPLRIFISDPSLFSGALAFLTLVQYSENPADYFNRVRLVAASIKAKANTVSLQNTTISGSINHVQSQTLIPFKGLSYNSIIPYGLEGRKVFGQTVADGVVGIHFPIVGQEDYYTPQTQAVFSRDQVVMVRQTLVGTTASGTSAILQTFQASDGSLPDPCSGWITLSLSGNTDINAAAAVTVSFKLYWYKADSSTWVVTEQNVTYSNTNYVNVGQQALIAMEETLFINENLHKIEVIMTSAGGATIKNYDITASILLHDYYFPGQLCPTHFIAIQNMNVDTILDVSMIGNFEVVPNPELIKNTTLILPRDDPIEIDYASAVYRQVGKDPWVRTVYPGGDYETFRKFGQLSARATGGSIYQAAGPSLKNTMRSLWDRIPGPLKDAAGIAARAGIHAGLGALTGGGHWIGPVAQTVFENAPKFLSSPSYTCSAPEDSWSKYLSETDSSTRIYLTTPTEKVEPGFRFLHADRVKKAKIAAEVAEVWGETEGGDQPIEYLDGEELKEPFEWDIEKAKKAGGLVLRDHRYYQIKTGVHRKALIRALAECSDCVQLVKDGDNMRRFVVVKNQLFYVPPVHVDLDNKSEDYCRRTMQAIIRCMTEKEKERWDLHMIGKKFDLQWLCLQHLMKWTRDLPCFDDAIKIINKNEKPIEYTASAPNPPGAKANKVMPGLTPPVGALSVLTGTVRTMKQTEKMTGHVYFPIVPTDENKPPLLASIRTVITPGPPGVLWSPDYPNDSEGMAIRMLVETMVASMGVGSVEFMGIGVKGSITGPSWGLAAFLAAQGVSTHAVVSGGIHGDPINGYNVTPVGNIIDKFYLAVATKKPFIFPYFQTVVDQVIEAAENDIPENEKGDALFIFPGHIALGRYPKNGLIYGAFVKTPIEAAMFTSALGIHSTDKQYVDHMYEINGFKVSGLKKTKKTTGNVIGAEVKEWEPLNSPDDAALLISNLDKVIKLIDTESFPAGSIKQMAAIKVNAQKLYNRMAKMDDHELVNDSGVISAVVNSDSWNGILDQVKKAALSNPRAKKQTSAGKAFNELRAKRQARLVGRSGGSGESSKGEG